MIKIIRICTLQNIKEPTVEVQFRDYHMVEINRHNILVKTEGYTARFDINEWAPHFWETKQVIDEEINELL